ncbi:hypothetical protein AGMMS49546_18060 [Spirochaetia bacterium]|nr:hypothetical protein AGMMS49546_18060 [Spirochaetia bacterium]
MADVVEAQVEEVVEPFPKAKKGIVKLNCWEVKKCGREPGGSKISELGVCPATTEPNFDGLFGGKNSGRACWVVAGTFCKGVVNGTFANKFKNCSVCDFYTRVMEEEGGLFHPADIVMRYIDKTHEQRVDERTQEIREAKEAVETAKAALQIERDEIAAMKDNLNEGLFLLNKDHLIQPQYSRALEGILGGSELQGQSFLDLLSASFNPKDLDLVKDYFEMVRSRAMDKETLEDINPLKELSYKSVAGGTEKTLSCIFSTVERGAGELFILGSILDITVEKKLQKQLAEEERKRQDEMRTLFDVFKVDPRVMKDFLEDADYEFNRSNEILKDSGLSHRQAMVDIYQCIHAIKSNAVILGLENFGNKLHDLETLIKKLREKENLAAKDILPVSAGIGKMMGEKDRLEDTIQKISAFRTEETKIQDQYVLVETLSRAVAKASEDLGKKARFVVNEIAPGALEKGPRRLMKEILLQLVRNSVYHGIESPAERAAAGKDEAGTITLTIKLDQGQIHISLKDDGKGLDFESIRKKALELHLLQNREEGDKKALLNIIFAPEFSTAESAGAHAGRGIGLNLVRERVKEINGSIKVQTERGKGTAFNIFIPPGS